MKDLQQLKPTTDNLKEYCYTWLVKAFSTGLRQNPHDANNSEFYLPMIELEWSKKMASDLDELIKQIKIVDRESLFNQMAMQIWDCYMEDEDGNINERECAIGYDENGVPNSVSLVIYGRTHSDMEFI